MTVYLGDSGAVQIKRKSGEPIRGTLVSGDVSVEKRRFSLADHDIQGELISGDQVDIKRTDGGNLQLVADHAYPDWRGYVFIDQLGGIRLYKDFSSALVGALNSGIELVSPTENQQLEISTRASNYNYVGEVISYELTTERDTVDITQLGNQFKQQYEAGLISGQGQLNCYFEYRRGTCDPYVCPPGTEYSMYLAQLCIRLTQGADFIGRYFIYNPNSDDSVENNQSVWYDAECVVTNCTISVAATEAIEATINFVTTGQIKLLTGVPPSFLLQEDSAMILQEDGTSRLLLAGQDV